ncbi:hypothetical protein Y032_0038g3586 [Ancylostoma ceylanicum]|uniref:Apyrase n=1 Tax=Ancylostoma ceylanicum TaxID=53326 RepID=A0A016UIM9_9BILA|nr:hypothetical protein Y032_0038g3586 [Ancylostoma ceylanicum]
MRSLHATFKNFISRFSLSLGSCPKEIIPRTLHIEDKPNGLRTYQLLAITDMDKSTHAEQWKWRAVTRRGELTINLNRTKVEVKWKKELDQNITSGFNYKGRGMELSDISEYDGRLLSPDDKTGMLYELRGNEAVPWIFLNSGPGNTTSGMKVEWLTIKNGFLYAGGHGCEYRDKQGEVVTEDPMWVKRISRKGVVTSLDWRRTFRRMRKIAGYGTPGYLTHEAVQWSDIQNKWFFLPRKASKTRYNETVDETMGTNLLITSPDLKKFNVVHIGGELKHPERGFSAFDFVPDTADRIIVALKSKELGNETASYITVFNIDGTVLLEDQRLDDELKFEGIYFV